MANQEYIESILPERFTILGRQLKPLALGHVFQLERLGVLPVSTPDHLVTAVLVCSLDPTDVDDVLDDRWLPWRVAWWKFRLGKIDWAQKFTLWTEYYADHTRAPSVIRKKDNDTMKHSGTPFVQHLKVVLQSRLNYSPAEAWAAPFSQALFDYYAWHELEGALEVADREFRAEMGRQADEMHDKWIKMAEEMHAKNGERN